MSDARPPSSDCPKDQHELVENARERIFTGNTECVVNAGLALLSVLTVYWTLHVSADVMWKYALYIMAVFSLTLLLYPFEKEPRVNRVSFVDSTLILGTVAGSLYAVWEYNERFMRLGMLDPADLYFGCIMLVIGLEVGRRIIGWSLTSVSLVLLLYALFGFMVPGHFGHSGFDMESIITQVYAGMEGYYGLSAKMMLQYVAPFILMGAFLEKSGAGDFFIRLAFAVTRNTVGGPAKAAVIGSALLGSISGSAVANVSSTGVLTIPMMKRVGYRPHVAGAVEAAASTGGQIMPPIMGAVAFLMAEFTQIPYLTIVIVATIPIILYYISVMSFIHFEAKKYNIGVMHDATIRPTREVLREGWHYFVAILVILVIMAFGYSPGFSAMGGIATLIVTHSLLHGRIDWNMLYNSLVLGGRYSLNVGSLVGCIGIILSMVGLTGVGLKLSWLFTTLANGNFFIAIMLVGAISMILGMGLASGPAYIVTAIAVGPALMDMGFPLLTAHFIMLWFSIDSEITPPVGLASIVAAGIANADPMKTMFTAFKYAKGLYILPVMFYYRPGVLLQTDPLDIVITTISILFGLIAIASAWESYMLRWLTWYERVAMLAAGLALLMPQYILNLAGIALFACLYFMQRATTRPSVS